MARLALILALLLVPTASADLMDLHVRPDVTAIEPNPAACSYGEFAGDFMAMPDSFGFTVVDRAATFACTHLNQTIEVPPSAKWLELDFVVMRELYADEVRGWSASVQSTHVIQDLHIQVGRNRLVFDMFESGLVEPDAPERKTIQIPVDGQQSVLLQWRFIETVVGQATASAALQAGNAYRFSVSDLSIGYLATTVPASAAIEDTVHDAGVPTHVIERRVLRLPDLPTPVSHVTWYPPAQITYLDILSDHTLRMDTGDTQNLTFMFADGGDTMMLQTLRPLPHLPASQFWMWSVVGVLLPVILLGVMVAWTLHLRKEPPEDRKYVLLNLGLFASVVLATCIIATWLTVLEYTGASTVRPWVIGAWSIAALVLSGAGLLVVRRAQSLIMHRQMLRISAEDDRLRARNEELTDLARLASHDMQEPLRGLMLRSELVNRRLQAGDTATAAEQAAHLRGHARHLQGQLLALLQYHEGTNARLQSEPVDLQEMVHRIKCDMRENGLPDGTRVCLRSLTNVHGDAIWIEHILRNLMENSIKYRRDDRAPVLQIWQEELPGRTKVVLRDNGIGIPDELRDRVWGMYERLHRQDQIPGTGMGLALVKRMVERQGGAVGIVTRATGTDFWFTLPHPDASPISVPGVTRRRRRRQASIS